LQNPVLSHLLQILFEINPMNTFTIACIDRTIIACIPRSSTLLRAEKEAKI
jgi:hypothetical protein